MGLHPGPDITTPAAASLAGLPEYDTNKLLTKLTEAYLIKQHVPGRYQFHDLLSVYAAEQASIEDPKPQQQKALHRVLDYYLHTGAAALRHLDLHRGSIIQEIIQEDPQSGTIPDPISDYQQALEWFTAEHAVLLAVIDYAATRGFDTHAWQIPWTLATFLNRRGHWHDYVATQHTALAAADRLGDHTAQAHTHHAFGHAHISLRHYTDASAHLQQALTLYQELGDRDGQARTHLSLGMVWARQGHYTEAIAHAQHALDLSRATGNRVLQAHALNNLGWYHAQLGDYQQTLTHCQEALKLHRELDNRRGEADTLDSLGYAHHHLEQHNQAITHYHQSITLYRALGNHYNEADTLTRLGDTHHTTGNTTAAHDTWQQALTILDRLGHPDADTVRTKLENLTPDPDADSDTGISD